MFVLWNVMSGRAITPAVHAAVEMVLGPAIMVAPFLLGFGRPATVIAVAIGAALIGLSLQAEGTGRAVPLSAHAGFDYTLAAIATTAGISIGLTSGSAAGIFLVGVGAVLAALTASTRFSAVRGA